MSCRQSKTHEIVAGFLDVLGGRFLEAYAATQSVRCGMPVRFFNGGRVEIVSDKLTLGKSSRHEQGRKADAAADIGDLAQTSTSLRLR